MTHHTSVAHRRVAEQEQEILELTEERLWLLEHFNSLAADLGDLMQRVTALEKLLIK